MRERGCERNAHDKNCARSMRAVKDSLATPSWESEESLSPLWMPAVRSPRLLKSIDSSRVFPCLIVTTMY